MIGHLKTGPGHNAFFLSRFFVVGQVQSVRFVLFCIAQRKLVLWTLLAAFSLGWPRFWSWLSPRGGLVAARISGYGRGAEGSPARR